MVRVRVGSWVDLQKTRVESQINLFLLQIKKIKFGSGQKILICFTMSIYLTYKKSGIFMIQLQVCSNHHKHNHFYCLSN